jgi:hypothetical protein
MRKKHIRLLFGLALLLVLFAPMIAVFAPPDHSLANKGQPTLASQVMADDTEAFCEDGNADQECDITPDVQE